MGQYIVAAPCAFINSAGAAVVHRRVGTVVEIDDDIAATLHDAVTPVETLAAPGVDFSQAPPVDHSVPAAVVDENAASVPVEHSEPANLAVPVEEPLDKPKARRGKSDPKPDVDGQD